LNTNLHPLKSEATSHTAQVTARNNRKIGMTSQHFEISPKSYARIAGTLYLVIAVFGAFAIGYVPSVIIESGNASVSASNLAANLTLFKAGIFADIVVLLVEVVLTALLYVMFKPISKTLTTIAAYSRFAMVLVMAVNLLINIMPLTLLGSADNQNTLEPAQLQAAIMLFLTAHEFGIYVWQLFFGMHLVAIGYMVIKSNIFPHLLGWAMLIGAFGYSLQGVVKILNVENTVLSIVIIGLLIIVTIGELAFALWLLLKGPRSFQ